MDQLLNQSNPVAPKLTAGKSTGRLKWALIGSGLVVVIIAGWWLWGNHLGNSGCVVGQTGKVYGTPPAVKHMYAGESLSYRLRSDGQFVPIDNN